MLRLRSSTGGNDASDQSRAPLGDPSADFKFGQLSAKVEFLEFTAKPLKGVAAELGAVNGWLESVLAN